MNLISRILQNNLMKKEEETSTTRDQKLSKKVLKLDKTKNCENNRNKLSSRHASQRPNQNRKFNLKNKK